MLRGVFDLGGSFEISSRYDRWFYGSNFRRRLRWVDVFPHDAQYNAPNAELDCGGGFWRGGFIVIFTLMKFVFHY